MRTFLPLALLALVACDAKSHAVAPNVEASTSPTNDGDGDEGDEGDDEMSATPTTGTTTLIAEADRELHAMRSSTYGHTPHVDEASGSYVYDCSGFVGYAVSCVSADALRAVAAVRNEPGKRPLAKHFEAFFAGLPASGAGRWTRIDRAVDLVPGDVIAWIKPADSKSKNTGHVVMVHGAPSQHGADPHEILIPIVDSTALPHGSTDSRSAAHATGLGTGSIVLVVDDAGRPRGFRWTPASKKIHVSPIAMGRLK